MLSADPNVAALVPAGNSRADALHVDVVFPVLHGTFGEDGAVQGLLDLAGLPYVGSGVLGSAVGMDKDVQKRLFLQAKLPVGDFLAIPRAEWEKSRAKVLREIRKKFRFPVFVKPATLGSSVGMTKAHDAKELAAAMDFAGEFGQKIMVERAIRGREIELSVLGNEDPKASIPGEIIPHREFYDYAAKYLEEGTRLMIPAKLTKAQVKKFQEYAVRAFRTLELSGHGPRGFFPRAPHRENPSERDQHDPRLHVHQHVPETLGSFRPALPPVARPPDRTRPRAAPRTAAHQIHDRAPRRCSFGAL